MFRNHCDENIAYEQNETFEPLCVWPKVFPYRPRVSVNDMAEEQGDWMYRVYNPAGWIFISIIMPPTESVVHAATNVAIKDDLFQMSLAMRAGEDYSLKARAYGEEYIIDLERKIIYSPGRDEKAFTHDDIKLAINPEVLGIK